MPIIHHALVLNLHQPSGNLQELLAKPNPKGEHGWEGKEILFSFDRIARSLWNHEDRARIHLSASGTLLETLASPEFQKQVYGIVKTGDMLWHWQNRKIIDILGTGYYHPVMPLIPEADRSEHVRRWKGIASHIFWRPDFQGFWPPEMGFNMEMIPMLKRHGFHYVIVDSNNVSAVTPMSWQELRYRPHIARYEGSEIIVVVRDREVSDAQESGMELGWFLSEVEARTRGCNFEPLVTTATDGENGGWFRNFRDNSNFWNVFYIPLLEHVGQNEVEVKPTFIHDYLEQFGTFGEVTVNEAAWNTGWHNGVGFTQWTGSDAQKNGLNRIRETSTAVHRVRDQIKSKGLNMHEIDEAWWHLLRAETSCNYFWGEDWVSRSHADLDLAWRHIENAEGQLRWKQ